MLQPGENEEEDESTEYAGMDPVLRDFILLNKHLARYDGFLNVADTHVRYPEGFDKASFSSLLGSLSQQYQIFTLLRGPRGSEPAESVSWSQSI